MLQLTKAPCVPVGHLIVKALCMCRSGQTTETGARSKQYGMLVLPGGMMAVYHQLSTAAIMCWAAARMHLLIAGLLVRFCRQPGPSIDERALSHASCFHQHSCVQADFDFVKMLSCGQHGILPAGCNRDLQASARTVGDRWSAHNPPAARGNTALQHKLL